MRSKKKSFCNCQMYDGTVEGRVTGSRLSHCIMSLCIKRHCFLTKRQQLLHIKTRTMVLPNLSPQTRNSKYIDNSLHSRSDFLWKLLRPTMKFTDVGLRLCRSVFALFITVLLLSWLTLEVKATLIALHFLLESVAPLTVRLWYFSQTASQFALLASMTGLYGRWRRGFRNRLSIQIVTVAVMFVIHWWWRICVFAYAFNTDLESFD